MLSYFKRLSSIFILFSFIYSQNPVLKDDFIFIFPDKGYEGTPLIFEVKPIDPQYHYVWDFGHSSQYEVFNWKRFEDRSMGNKVEFTYPGQGRNNGFTVKVTIYKDRINRASKIAEYEKFIPILNVAPTVSLIEAPTECFEGEELFFKGSHTDPGAADKHVYYWNFDGKKLFGPNDSYKNTSNMTYTYYDDGLYTLYAFAQDDDGDSDTVYHQIRVKNSPPLLEGLEHPPNSSEGDRISFRASYFDQGLNDLHEFYWNFGDGGKDTTFNNLTDYVYEDNGNFEIQLIIKDNAGDSDTLTSSISIENLAPKIKVTIPEFGDEGTPIPLSLSIKDAGKKDTHKIHWDLGDGHIDSSSAFTHNYLNNGEYTINVNVVDDDGATDSWIQKIQIYNLPPKIEFAFADSSYEGQTVLFNVIAEDSGINDELTYVWNFGDGNVDSNKSAQHQFADNGEFEIYITVKDDDGATSSLSKKLLIKNIPPVLEANFPIKQHEGKKVKIDARVKSDPGSDDTHTYQFDYGDGTISNDPFHIYQDNGEFTIQAILFDDDGGSDTISQQIEIVNQPPKILGKLPTHSNEGELVIFEPTVEDPGNLDTHTYFWDFGDGNRDSTLLSEYTYVDNGKFEIKLKVVDDDGGEDSLMQEIEVKNLPPILSASFVSSSKVQIPEEESDSTGVSEINQTIDIAQEATDHRSPTGDKDATVYFKATVIDSGIIDTHSYVWDFGDGTSSNKSEVQHTYTQNGVFPVSIIVMDDDKGSDTLNQTITITNVTPAMGATVVSPDSIHQSVIILPLDLDGAKETNTFTWDFGDGNSTDNSLPTHYYNNYGDYLLSARVIDINGETAVNVESINISEKYPTLTQEEKVGIVDSGNSGMYFSNDIFIISCPRIKTYNPNSFPTLVFNLLNLSDEETDINLNLLMPNGWDIISISKPTTLRPNKVERLRVTFNIPYNENADIQHKIRLIAKIGDYDHMVSMMTIVNVNIKEKPAFQVDAYKEIEEVFVNKKNSIEFLIRNIGNVTDSYNITSTIPGDWKLVHSPEIIELPPDSSHHFKLKIVPPKKTKKIAGQELTVQASSTLIKSYLGIWHNAIDSKDGYCSDQRPSQCSIPSRLDEIDCVTEGIWIPKIEAKLAHCSNSLFTTKEECERKSSWIEAVKGVPSICTDEKYTSMKDCVDNGDAWTVGTPDTPAYCSEKKITSKEECIAEREWLPTIKAEAAYCKSLPNRTSKADCVEIGNWLPEFQGSMNQQDCEMINTWYPTVNESEAYCSESYWSNKADCESVSEWIQDKSSKDEKCLDGISITKNECETSGEWFDTINFQEAYCSDSTIVTEDKCIQSYKWTPPIIGKPAYCSDLVSTTQLDCENPPGLTKDATVKLYSRLKKTKPKSKSMFAYIPLIIGTEIGNYQSEYLPNSRFFIEAPTVNLGKYKMNFNYSQRFNEYELSDSLEASENANLYLNDYTIDKLQFYLSHPNWELYLGDSYVDKYNLVTNISPIPIYGLNGAENFRGAFINYKFENIYTTLGGGNGPMYNKDYQIISLSVGQNYKENQNSFYSMYYHAKIDSNSRASHFVDIQRVSTSESFNTGQILALTSTPTATDGAVQLVFDKTFNKTKLISRFYHFGEFFDDLIKGFSGIDLSSYTNVTDNLYSFNRFQYYNQLLYNSYAIYTQEDFEDCGIDQECTDEIELYDDGENNGEFDEGEEFHDYNENGIFDVDTTYVENVNVLKIDPKIFYEFKYGIRFNVGVGYEQNNYSNGDESSATTFGFRLLKTFQVHQPYFSYEKELILDVDGSEVDKTSISFGNRSLWSSFSLNFNQDITFPYTQGPTEFLTSFDGRFKLFSLDWRYILIVDNLCPLCTGELEKGQVRTFAVENIFLINFLGMQNKLKLGIGYIPNNQSFTYTFALVPSGNRSKSSQIRVPFPLIKVKGQYAGEIYIDENENGQRDINEKGVPNLMLFLNGSTAITDANGYFEFGALEPGVYYLNYDPNTLDAKYKFKDQFPHSLTISEGIKTYENFPLSPVCKIKGVMYIDEDLDSKRDKNEIVVKSAKIIVQRVDNSEEIVYTDEKGRYEIPDLKVGTYNLIIDDTWLPERTVSTYSDESKKIFTKLGWPVTVSNAESEIQFDIPINKKELEIRIDVKNTSNETR